jgi:hypothetical protein
MQVSPPGLTVADQNHQELLAFVFPQYSGNFLGCGKLRVVVVLRNEEVKN